MNATGLSLLRMLAGGVRPVDAPTPIPADRPTLDFRAALERARSGAAPSGLPVRVPPPLRAAVSPEDASRLSEATDLAASEGMRRALVLLGKRMFRVDVPARTVIDAPTPDARAIDGVDGVVRLPPEPAGGDATPAAGPARVVRNPSLIRALEALGPESD